MGTYVTLAGLITGLAAEGAAIGVSLNAALDDFESHCNHGNIVTAVEMAALRTQVAKIVLLGVDDQDPIPGRSE